MSITANPPSWIETVFQIGVKRSALLQQLTLLKRQHNEVIPIGQLPAEILALIFHYLMNEDWETTWNVQRSVKSRQLETELELVVTASQVCHRWRDVALQDSTLWTLWSTFEFRCSFWLQEVKKRSQRSPLTLRILPSLGTPGVTALKAHSSRIRRLEIALGDSKSTLAHLKNPHPLLESLILSYSAPHSSSALRARPWSSDSMLPKTVFAGKAPRLSKVSLISVLVDLRLPIFANVVSLSISKIRLEWEDLVDHLITGFKAMRYLETLKISHSILALAGISSSIPLPKLRLLEITGELLPSSRLLSKLRTASTCSIHVMLSVDSKDPTAADLMGEYISRTTEDYLHDTTSIRWAITLTNGSLEIGYRKHRFEKPCFSLTLEQSPESITKVPFHTITPTLLTPLLSRISSYDLRINSNTSEKSIFSNPEIVELFFGQPSVTSIGFNGGEAFFQAVPHLVLHAQNTGKISSPYLPSLRKVQFRNILTKTPETKRKVIRFLNLRSKGGSPIQVVDLVSCAGAVLMVNALKEDFEDLELNILNR